MGRTALQSLSVLHHRLDGIGVQRTGETLRLALHTLHNRYGEPFLGEVGVDAQHSLRLLLRLFTGGVGGVSLLPEKLRRAEERPCAHLPPHDVAPLVAHQRQVTPRMDPVLIGVPDDGLTRRADDEFLLQFRIGVDLDAVAVLRCLQAVVRHHGTLLGKSFHVLSLTGEEALRNQQREISVLHAGLLEHPVELRLHLLPYRIAVGFDDHTATYGRLFRQFCLHYQVIVPLRVVLCPLGHVFQFFCHNYIFLLYTDSLGDSHFLIGVSLLSPLRETLTLYRNQQATTKESLFPSVGCS